MSKDQVHQTFLLLGSNLGDRAAHLHAAKQAIAEKVGHVVNSSAVYETQPWGVTDQPNYLNASLLIQTDLGPMDLLNALRSIEVTEGRINRKKYASRTLDIDILLYDDVVMNTPALVIPHPKMHLRKFALIPLAEIGGRWIHPVLMKSVDQLLSECTDQLEVKPFLPAAP